MNRPRKVELLAPARTAEIGHEAILHGADAVYIGAPAFGARAAAANSVDDIAALTEFAHLYDAKVYVTLNTIIYDEELEAARNLVCRLYDIGVDALIVQDMALLEMDIPPIDLHASTQMDITTAERAALLEKLGFKQIVLARELGLDDIRKIRSCTTFPLEAFVHGALCVSYSGRCYASQICMGRSANRGECAQFCRLPFDLIDGNGKIVERDKHLLSLRDMDRSASLEDMLDAGVSSFKIEGRLKDMSYVKNITAYYRKALDEILSRRPTEYVRASSGESDITFEPQPEKSFNRGFTEYFLRGRSAVHQFDTPKSLGGIIGKVSKTDLQSFCIDTDAVLKSGDGLCYFDAWGKLQGIRANRVEGKRVFPLRMPEIRIGTEVWRNHDQAFTTRLQSPTASRHIKAVMSLRQTDRGYELSLKDETGTSTTICIPSEIQEAKTPQRENITRILSKSGNKALKIEKVEIHTETEPFIPSSTLTELRRTLVAKHISKRLKRRSGGEVREYINPSSLQSLARAAFSSPGHELNVSNRLAARAYTRLGIDIREQAVEIQKPTAPFAIMTCRHCLLYAMNLCKKRSKTRLTEPLSLRMSDGRTFPLTFDCSRCEMRVMSSTSES